MIACICRDVCTWAFFWQFWAHFTRYIFWLTGILLLSVWNLTCVTNLQVNVLNTSMLGEFEEMLQKLNSDSRVNSAVFISGKSDCFIAGADVKWGSLSLSPYVLLEHFFVVTFRSQFSEMLWLLRSWKLQLTGKLVICIWRFSFLHYSMLAGCKTVEEATQISRDGQKIMSDIEKNSKPIVAAIMGSCLGGGLEVRMNFWSYSCLNENV